MLRVDPRNPRAEVLRRALASRVSLSSLPDELCLVMGGDGWMLACIRELGPDRIYLGLNAGHLGFLLNDTDDLDGVAAALAGNCWSAHTFPRLALSAEGVDGSTYSALAVNDLYVERSTGQTAHLRLAVDGQTVVDRMICDGLIVATALGSTAYTYSAGGVPCHPTAQVLQVAPICPHAPRLSPVVLPLKAQIEIEALASHRRPVRVVADGQDLGLVTRVRVAEGGSDVRLAFLDGHDFTRTLIEKVFRRSDGSQTAR
jgi:NAD+ kinase